MSKQLSIIDWIKIVLLGICTVVIKGMYMPILLLIFLIPSHKKEIKKEIKKEKIGRLLVISIVVVITMLINKNLVGHISGVTSGMDIEIGHTNSRSIYSVLFDPFDLICLIGNTIVVQSVDENNNLTSAYEALLNDSGKFFSKQLLIKNDTIKKLQSQNAQMLLALVNANLI